MKLKNPHAAKHGLLIGSWPGNQSTDSTNQDSERLGREESVPTDTFIQVCPRQIVFAAGRTNTVVLAPYKGEF